MGRVSALSLIALQCDLGTKPGVCRDMLKLPYMVALTLILAHSQIAPTYYAVHGNKYGALVMQKQRFNAFRNANLEDHYGL